MRGPRVTGRQPWSAKSCISSGVQPPSGPMARAVSCSCRAARAAAMVFCCSVSASRIFVGAETSSSAAFNATGSSTCGMSLPREDRRYPRGAEFGGLFDAPLQVIELENGKQEMDGQSGFGFEFFVEREYNFTVRDCGNFGAMEKPVCHYVEDLSRLGAQNAGEVRGLVAGERCGISIRCVGDPAAASHAVKNSARERWCAKGA